MNGSYLEYYWREAEALHFRKSDSSAQQRVIA